MRTFRLHCYIFFFIVCIFINATFTYAAPKQSIEPCDESDPVCLKNIVQMSLPNFVKGYPELGTDNLDPFYIDKLDLMLPGGLKIQFRDGQTKGLRKCVVEKARAYEDILETHYRCNLLIVGKYSSSGRLLMFPINGDGDATIKCKNVRLTSILKLKTVNGPVEKHLEIVNSTINYSYDGRIHYNLTNLFNGSPETSKIVLEFMNQNWRMVAQEFGDPIVEFGLEIILKNIKKLFTVLPLNRMFSTWEPNPPKK